MTWYMSDRASGIYSEVNYKITLVIVKVLVVKIENTNSYEKTHKQKQNGTD